LTLEHVARLGAVSVSTSDRLLPIRNSARGRSGLTDWQCRRVRTFVSENIAGSIKVRDLASQAKISVGHFGRCFTIAFGVSPSSFVMGERMAKAKALMANSNCPLSSVAEQCGLSDHAHFCRLFRRLEGLPPSEWRRQAVELRAGSQSIL